MKTYTVSISDGMSRSGGGETQIQGRLGAVRKRAASWARRGDYTSTDGSPVAVDVVIADESGDVVDRMVVVCDTAVCS